MTIALWRCTYLLILPAMLRFVVEEQTRCPRNVGSVRLCLAGGDTVPVTLQEIFALTLEWPYGRYSA